MILSWTPPLLLIGFRCEAFVGAHKVSWLQLELGECDETRRNLCSGTHTHTHTLPPYGCDVTPFIEWAKLSYDSELLRANCKWSSNLKRNRFDRNKIRFYNCRHLIFHTHTQTQRWRWLILNKFICTIHSADRRVILFRRHFSQRH